MNFLDLNGLNYLWAKIKASCGTAIVNNSDYKTEPYTEEHIRIPFVANHQIVKMDYSHNINVYDWFQKASKGGILEVVFAGAQGGYTFCHNNGNSYMYKMSSSPSGPILNNAEFLATEYNTYARLIKTDDNKLVVAEFVQNK